MGKTAIEAPRGNYFLVDPRDLVIIGLDTADGPEHALYDERIKLPIDRGMVASIKKDGVLEIIKARKNGDRLEVVNGRRRTIHGRVANDELADEGKQQIRVKVEIVRGPDADLFGIAISMNEFRQDDDAMTRARKASRLLSFGKSPAEVCVQFGLQTESALDRLLSLLDLTPRVQGLIESGKISATAGTKIAKLPREEQGAAVDLVLAEEKPTADAAEAVVKAKRSGGEVERTIGKVAFRRLLAAWQKGELDDIEDLALTEEHIQGIQLVLGWRSPSSIRGLTQALRMAGERK